MEYDIIWGTILYAIEYQRWPNATPDPNVAFLDPYYGYIHISHPREKTHTEKIFNCYFILWFSNIRDFKFKLSTYQDFRNF